MIVSDTLVLDGLLSSNGGAGVKHPSYSFSSGGGSGGSIWVESSQISGSGSMTARGGSATSTSYMGGGGSGGRIAVHTLSSTYLGSMLASGGTGYNSPGASGTIYLNISSTSHRSLILDNRPSTVRAMETRLLSSSSVHYTFEHLGLYGGSVLNQFEGEDDLTVWQTMAGDEYSLLIVAGDTRALLVSEIYFNIRVESTGSFKLDPTLQLFGVDFEVKGVLYDASNVSLSRGIGGRYSSLQFYSTGSTTSHPPGSYSLTNIWMDNGHVLSMHGTTSLSLSGELVCGSSTTVNGVGGVTHSIVSSGDVIFGSSSTISFTSGGFSVLSSSGDVSFGSLSTVTLVSTGFPQFSVSSASGSVLFMSGVSVSASSISVVGSSVSVSSGTVLSTNEKGYSSASGTSPGSSTASQYQGCGGAGHAGYGGTGYSSISGGLVIYGDLYAPDSLGSGGGSDM